MMRSTYADSSLYDARLGPRAHEVLCLLRSYPGWTARTEEIADHVPGLTAGEVRRVMERMERLGLVERETHDGVTYWRERR